MYLNSLGVVLINIGQKTVNLYFEGLADDTIALLNHQRKGPDHENY
jgi:hypothetical protein